METRIEIYNGERWVRLDLGDSKSVKFNAVINRIGDINNREISHSNTFSIPETSRNMSALGLNKFNPSNMATSLNKKYKANYYIEDRLVQTGFVVINNTYEGNINLNFIDEALSLVEVWGATTFKELLQSPNITRPSDYQAVIDDMKTYDMSKTSILTPQPDIGSRGYKLALFPNTLNAIGDGWQINVDELRVDDAINPYQSRTVYNAKSLFDLATESFGFTPIYDNSVDWSEMEKYFIINSDLVEDELEEGGVVDTIYTGASDSIVFSIGSLTTFGGSNQDLIINRFTLYLGNMSPNLTNVVIPSSNSALDLDELNETMYTLNSSSNTIPAGDGDPSWKTTESIIIPDLSSTAVGSVDFTIEYDITRGTPTLVTVEDTGTLLTQTVFIWNDGSGGYIYENAQNLGVRPDEDNNPLSDRITVSNNLSANKLISNLAIEKSIFNYPPSGATSLYGLLPVFIQIYRTEANQGSLTPLRFEPSEIILSEGTVPGGVVSYDSRGQYISDTIDLTHAAPTKNIKELLAGLMAKEGILLDINNKTKEVLFFSYLLYNTNRANGNFSDWSKYLRKYSPVDRNVDYGNNYGKLNEIGLKSPYSGNTYFFELAGEGTKHKEYASNFNKVYSDVDGVFKVKNTTIPYTEYMNTRLGLVYYDGDISGLTQVRYDKSQQGTINNVAHLVNINYAAIPDSLREWFNYVGESLKIRPEFLLPVNVFREIDLSQPIYIDTLGGFYIIEEVQEYTDNLSTVKVKLIKLINIDS